MALIKALDRRTFLKRLITGLLASIGALVGVPTLGYLVTSALALPTRTRVPLGPVTLGPDPVAVELSYAARDAWRESSRKALLYVRQTDQGVEALSSRCTHLGCTVRYEPATRRFPCPCHGSVFDLEGQVLHGPAERPLERYPVRVVNGHLYVEVA